MNIQSIFGNNTGRNNAPVNNSPFSGSQSAGFNPFVNNSNQNTGFGAGNAFSFGRQPQPQTTAMNVSFGFRENQPAPERRSPQNPMLMNTSSLPGPGFAQNSLSNSTGFTVSNPFQNIQPAHPMNEMPRTTVIERNQSVETQTATDSAGSKAPLTMDLNTEGGIEMPHEPIPIQGPIMVGNIDISDLSKITASVAEHKKQFLSTIEKNYPQVLPTQLKCYICFEKIKEAHICPTCKNVACGPCIVRWIEQHASCPACRSNLTEGNIIRVKCMDELITLFDNQNKTPAAEEIFDEVSFNYLYICETCQKVIQPDELILDKKHEGHKLKAFKELYAAVRDDILKRQQVIDTFIDNSKPKIDELKDQQKKINDKKTELQRDISALSQILMDDLQKKFNAKFDTVQNALNEKKLSLDSILEKKTQMENLLKDSTPLKLIQNQNKNVITFEEIEKVLKDGDQIMGKKIELNMEQIFPKLYSLEKDSSVQTNTASSVHPISIMNISEVNYNPNGDAFNLFRQPTFTAFIPGVNLSFVLFKRAGIVQLGISSVSSLIDSQLDFEVEFVVPKPKVEGQEESKEEPVKKVITFNQNQNVHQFFYEWMNIDSLTTGGYVTDNKFTINLNIKYKVTTVKKVWDMNMLSMILNGKPLNLKEDRKEEEIKKEDPKEEKKEDPKEEEIKKEEKKEDPKEDPKKEEEKKESTEGN
ncbi:MAG: hypothetical protein MJ252_17220 [archaeon]|nr:hypothetical protein [archaeon]